MPGRPPGWWLATNSSRPWCRTRGPGTSPASAGATTLTLALGRMECRNVRIRRWSRTTLPSGPRARRGSPGIAYAPCCLLPATRRNLSPCFINCGDFTVILPRWCPSWESKAMTAEDAMSLRRGDRVRVRYKGRSTVVIVDMVFPPRAGRKVIVCVERPGYFKTRRGNPFLGFSPASVEFERRPDDGTGNVYADWLEERGEARAAALLREVFPFPERAAP